MFEISVQSAGIKNYKQRRRGTGCKTDHIAKSKTNDRLFKEHSVVGNQSQDIGETFRSRNMNCYN